MPIVPRATFCQRMVQSLGVLVKGPIMGVLVHVRPMETGAAVGRVTEVINIQAFLTKAFHDIFVIWISPAGGNVDHRYVFLIPLAKLRRILYICMV